MAKLYVGNLPPSIPEFELEKEFGRFGRCKVWVARKPPGFGFVEFEDPYDGDDALRALDGFQGWRVELSRGPRGPGGPRGPPPPPMRFYDPPAFYRYRHSPPPRPYYSPPPRGWLPPPHSYRDKQQPYSPAARSHRHRSRSRGRVRDRSRSRDRRRSSRERGDRRRRSPSFARRHSRSRSGDHRRSLSRDRTNNHSPSPAADGAKLSDQARSFSPADDVSYDQHSGGGHHQRSRSPSPGSEYSGGRSDRSRSNSPA